MGVIVGTGCNATIPMKLSDLHESKADHVLSRNPDAVETVVNTEWTISGAAAPLRELNITTKWDIELDRACARPGFQPFEYMTGGRYIGELIRIILFDYLTNIKGLSREALPANLVQEYALTTMYISSIVAQTPSEQALVDKLNLTLSPPESSIWSWDVEAARGFRKVARAVQTRSAGLIAAAVVGLLACKGELKLRHDGATRPSKTCNGTLNSAAAAHHVNSAAGGHGDHTPPSSWQSGPEELVVAYTGGIIQQYPHFKETCQSYIDRLVIWDGPQESGKSVCLREARDGGIIGAGVLAGMVAGR
jgi:hexokinase